jgi:hypothetical protein
MTVEVHRYFTIQGSDLGFEGGRYKGKTPAVAARKAAKQLYRMIENKNKKREWAKYAHFASYDKIKFIIRETTQESDKKTFYYKAIIEDLPEPKVVKRGDIEYTVTKKITVTSCPGGVSSSASSKSAK